MLAAVVSGCSTNNPPRGTPSGRVPVGQSTPAEARDVRVLPADYMEFSDQLAAALVMDLPTVPAFAGVRSTIVYGDIMNKTGNISSAEFELVRERMKNRLMQSQTFRQNFRFLISKSQLEELRAMETGPAGAAVGNRIDPNTTYFLNGTMFRVSRGDTSLYLMTFQLVSFTTGEIVWTKDYESKRWGI
jgi:PBP1b-binding outer membrane lipoprotein LpoB